MQPKGAYYKYNTTPDPNAPVVPEIKIQKIEILNEVKDKLVNKLNITIPLEELDDEIALDMSDMVLQNKGNINVYFEVFDRITQQKVKLFARQCRVKMNKDFYNLLKKYKDEEKLDFDIK